MKNAVDIALREDFCAAALISAGDIAFNAGFRKYCEDNVCGSYGANYSCPPDCGAFEQMCARLQQYKNALVVQTKWDIKDYTDREAIWNAKHAHNEKMFRVIDQMNVRGLMCGASPCTLCKKCAILDGAPCKMPDKQFSCLSAYCIDVKALAEKCGMEYFCADGRVAFFGIYAF